MNEATPITGKMDRDHRNIRDDLECKLSDIYAVANLLSAVDVDDLHYGTVNATGICLTGMIKEADALSEEHLRLWQRGAS